MIKLSLSVHELVDFLLREGDIDNRFYNEETMKEGSRLHALYQAKQDSSYLSEVSFKKTFKRPLGEITLKGKADGLLIGTPTIIEEIKSSNDDLKHFSEVNYNWHKGQAICYAAMYLLDHEQEEKILIRLSYLSQKFSESFSKNELLTREEVFSLLEGYLDAYLDFSTELLKFKKKRDASLKKLEFPYPHIREGQARMMKRVEEVINNKNFVFLEAPTGTGKTLASIYPAIKGLNGSHYEKVFYLTAKSTGKEAIDKAMNELLDEGLKIRYISLLGKKKMCLLEESKCNPTKCPYCIDYYKKMRELLPELLFSNKPLTPFRIKRIASKRMLCPFEAQLDLSTYCDFIAMDYNYYFDPVAKLERFFAPPEGEVVKHFLLVDEAHNLPSRGRDCFSSTIEIETLKEAISELKPFKEVEKKYKSLIKHLNNLIKCIYDAEIVGDSDFLLEAEKYRDTLKDLSEKSELDIPFILEDIGRELYRYSKVVELGYSTLLLPKDRNDEITAIKRFCVDPKEGLSEAILEAQGGVIYSGTLSPMDYFIGECADLNLASKSSKEILPSPFSYEQQKLLIAPISLRYKDRDRTLLDVAKVLKGYVEGRVGNYLLFFPSFEYLNKIAPYFDNLDAEILIQKRGMSELDKKEFLSHFLTSPTRSVVGLSVLGGSFSEGIDLVSDRLIGVAVVGMGLPSPSLEKELVSKYYEAETPGSGFYKAYLAPGLNRVLQGLGRLIRTEDDYGTMLLVDNRYRGEIRQLFEDRFGSSNIVFKKEDTMFEVRKFFKEEKNEGL